MASRTVALLTFSIPASSRSAGSRCPGTNWPRAIAVTKRSAITSPVVRIVTGASNPRAGGVAGGRAGDPARPGSGRPATGRVVAGQEPRQGARASHDAGQFHGLAHGMDVARGRWVRRIAHFPLRARVAAALGGHSMA